MKQNWQELIGLLEENHLFTDQSAALRDLARRVQENELVISVVGQFKRGKSSLINAMLGEALLPVGIVPLTSVVTELRYGPVFRGQVLFADGTAEEIAPDQISSYCSEQENSGNHKGVRRVSLWTPRHPFGPGIVLADTPGVGSVCQNNTDAAEEHIVRSDAVLFLLSVDSPVSQTERDFLLKVREYAPKFFFAVNKADTVPPEDLTAFLDFCGRVIGECMGTGVTLRPVSARTGAGVPELTDALRDSLTASHDQLLSSSAERKLSVLTGQIRAGLVLAEQASALPASELRSKLRKMEQKRQELATFGEELEVLARHHTDALVERLREPLERDAARLKERAAGQCQALAEELRGLSYGEFRERFQNELDASLKQELGALNRRGTALLTEGYEDVTALLAGRAAEAEHYLASFLREEFGVDYPVEEERFEVSSQNDFFLQVGLRSLPRLYAELADRLLPRRRADARFLKESLHQAEEDIDCNLNNMLYNYRYKMQESLRPLCAELSARVERSSAALGRLAGMLGGHLDDADRHCAEESAVLDRIRAALDALEETA